MASFLDMEQKQRRMYVARMLGLDPYSPDSWPLDTIDSVIGESEKAAEMRMLDCVRHLTRRD